MGNMSPYKTFKVKGILGDQEVRILINSGASQNFILENLVRELKLEVKLFRGANCIEFFTHSIGSCRCDFRTGMAA